MEALPRYLTVRTLELMRFVALKQPRLNEELYKIKKIEKKRKEKKRKEKKKKWKWKERDDLVVNQNLVEIQCTQQNQRESVYYNNLFFCR